MMRFGKPTALCLSRTLGTFCLIKALSENYFPKVLAFFRSVIPMLLRPKSRGTIRLRSVNPSDKPIIEAGYFSHPNDMEVLVEGIKVVMALSQTEAFQSVGSRYWSKMPIPGCETLTIASDEYFACASRHFTSTIYHYSGTAKMGPPGTVLLPILNLKILNF